MHDILGPRGRRVSITFAFGMRDEWKEGVKNGPAVSLRSFPAGAADTS